MGGMEREPFCVDASEEVDAVGAGEGRGFRLSESDGLASASTAIVVVRVLRAQKCNFSRFYVFAVTLLSRRGSDFLLSTQALA